MMPVPGHVLKWVPGPVDIDYMRTRVRENAAAVATAAAALYIIGWLGLYGWAWTDYDDEARPAFDALVAGHTLHFLQLAPAYGGSLILRAPFVVASQLWGGGELTIFRAAAVPCLLASGVLAIWLVSRMRSLGRSAEARVIVLLLCAANPITLRALELGHPEELLGAVLCVAAVVAAMRDRSIWAAVFLGLAIANKSWAILAVGPVLIALSEHRVRTLLIAGAVAGVVLAPLVLAGSSGLAAQANPVSSARSTIFQPWQAWWFLGAHGHVVTGLWGNIKPGYRTPPGWIGAIAHPLIVLLSVPLTLLCVRLRRRGHRLGPGDALLLLVLLLLLRFVLDPWDNAYYPLPFLIALLVWEALTFDRVPVLSLAGTFGVWFIFQEATSEALGLSADAQSLIFLLLAIPTVIVTALGLYAPDALRWMGDALRRRRPLASPA